MLSIGNSRLKHFLDDACAFFGLKARMFNAFSTRRPESGQQPDGPSVRQARTTQNRRTSIMPPYFFASCRNVTFEGTRYGKLTQFMADHVFSHKHRYMLTTIMHSDRQTDEVGQHRGTT